MKIAKAIPLAIILVLLVNVYASAATGSGSIWTTKNDCGSESQDVNHFAVGDTVYINGANFSPGDHNWTITGKPGGASSDPGQVVASGVVTVGTSGKFCIPAYVVQPGDSGEYQVKVGKKGDNYRVKSVHPTNTPTLTKTPTSTNTLVPTNTNFPTNTNTPVPTSTNTQVPTDTSTPTNTLVVINTNTPTSTNTTGPGPSSTPTNTPSGATNTPTPKNPTKTPAPTNTSVVQMTNTLLAPSSTPTGLPTIVVVYQPTSSPPPSGYPYCGMQVVNATEDRRIIIGLTWRDADAIVGNWGDGNVITGLDVSKGYEVINHQYQPNQQVAMVVIVVGKGPNTYTCSVNVFFSQAAVASATVAVCGTVCQPPPCINGCQDLPSQSQSQEINIGLFSGDNPGSGSILLWCLVGILAVGAFLALIAVVVASSRRS